MSSHTTRKELDFSRGCICTTPKMRLLYNFFSSEENSGKYSTLLDLINDTSVSRSVRADRLSYFPELSDRGVNRRHLALFVRYYLKKDLASTPLLSELDSLDRNEQLSSQGSGSLSATQLARTRVYTGLDLSPTSFRDEDEAERAQWLIFMLLQEPGRQDELLRYLGNRKDLQPAAESYSRHYKEPGCITASDLKEFLERHGTYDGQ